MAALAIAIGMTATSADALPLFDGSLSFPSIQGADGPTEFSWEVQLDDKQALEQVDDHSARVYYIDDPSVTAFSISPEDAHDANGATVPTSLEVSEPNILTLHVHHQDGNPAAGGAPFLYPVTYGAGWEAGFSTVVIVLPPSIGPQTTPSCLVPKLTGRTLSAARKRLRNSTCQIGHIRIRRRATAHGSRVVKQVPRPGLTVDASTAIDFTAAPR